MAKTARKQAEKLTAQTPVAQAAEVLLGDRLREVARLLERAAQARAGTRRAERDVHELRVSTRRAEAAIDVFGGLLRGKKRKRACDRLKAIRKAAGEARDLDVQVEILHAAAEWVGGTGGAVRAALEELAEQTRERRERAHLAIEEAAERWPRAKLERKGDTLAEEARESEAVDEGTRLVDAARVAMDREIDRVVRQAGRDLTHLENVHALRVELKRLRYAMEVVEACFGKAWREGFEPELVAVQKRLGEINDRHVLLERVEREIGEHPKLGRVLQGMVAKGRRALEKGHATFLERWKELVAQGYFERMHRELGAQLGPNGAGGRGLGSESVASLPTRVLRPVGVVVEPKPAGLNGTHEAQRIVGRVGRSSGGRRRIAAIDVGTNSIRLIVAEAQPDGSYRIMDDEKEITRLGRGLSASGKLDAGAIEHTIVTVARMKSIAEGYGVEEIQVVGTAAAREAKNGAVLERGIRERAGLELKVISGEEEAMLAYRSAANAFDLATMSAAVVDVGGGSTEIVLSAAANEASGGGAPGVDVRRAGLGGGVIERVYTIPMGAVRLTDHFGGPEESSGARFEEMREHIKGLLRQHVGRAPIVPQVVIGTGGTLTTLAAMVVQKDVGASRDALFGASVQGVEVGRAELRHLLEYLRKLPVKERTRVPGLSADRADIIVAGLAIVDGVLKRFGANRVRVHEGGIRDGILLSMVSRGDVEARRDPMRGVRRFARSCGYEAAHAKHVTALALKIFDDLAAAPSGVELEDEMHFDSEARLLLEAAGLLHDVGYLVNYAQHHKHSYHLIVHADLPGLTKRQVQVVANVARYHRAAKPKERHRPFGLLSAQDQALVRGLSAILRIADGLDRTHMQNVGSVCVRVEGDAGLFELEGQREPSVDMWGAMGKSGLLKKVFGLTAHFEWKGAQAAEAQRGPKESVGGAKTAMRVR